MTIVLPSWCTTWNILSSFFASFFFYPIYQNICSALKLVLSVSSPHVFSSGLQPTVRDFLIWPQAEQAATAKQKISGPPENILHRMLERWMRAVWLHNSWLSGNNLQVMRRLKWENLHVAAIIAHHATSVSISHNQATSHEKKFIPPLPRLFLQPPCLCQLGSKVKQKKKGKKSMHSL